MKYVTIAILVLVPLISFSQRTLQMHDTIIAEIGANTEHTYKIYLKNNQLAQLNIHQEGIDVAVTTSDPTGKTLNEFDSPNGRFGPETIVINTKHEGFYTIRVSSIDDERTRGNYKIYAQRIVEKATDPLAQVDQIFLQWDTPKTPGAAISILKNDSIFYQKTFGSANLEYDIPIRPNTIFRTGSVAKQFTAFSILLLEKQGKLSLDDDIRTYIPEVPDFGHRITLRHLANHTSGLREEAVLAALMGWQESDVVTRGQMLKVVSTQKALNFEPGAQYMYCNTGYTLLAEVVARISGQTFAEFTAAHIFRPLQMKNTQFLDDYQKIIKNKAYSYYASGAGYKKSILNDANPGSSGLLTTIEDLSLWVLNFDKPIVGDRALFDKMQTSGILNNGEPINYGLGIETTSYHGLTDIGHGGALGGFRARIARFPEQDFAVILLANTPTVHPINVPNQIIDIFLKEDFTSTKNEQQAATPVVATKNEPWIPHKDMLSAFQGAYYSDELSVKYQVIVRDGKLIVEHPRVEINLTPTSKDTFKVEGWAPTQVAFIRDVDNTISGFNFSIVNTKNIIFSKIKL